MDAAAPVAVSTSDIFTPEQRAEIEKTEQKYEFQAEVNRMMDIIINSLYTNRDIFLRELISNAADALDKIRFLSLTDKAALGEGDVANLDIKIRFDKEAKTLTITDKGVGMSREELMKHLGVVAKSGTTEFVEAAASGKDALSLIGQFGVGFYSIYLVADKVTVTSKANGHDQYVWESTANSVYTIAKDPRGDTLGRGTEITLHLKDDAKEYVNERKLTDLVGKYSQFINFPIYVQVTKTVEVDEPLPEEEAAEDANKDKDDVEVGEEEDAGKKSSEPKTRKVSKQVTEDKRINSVKAIWTRAPADIEESEYTDFYKTLTKATDEPLEKLHFTAEGDISFKSILFVPKTADAGLYDKYYEKSHSLKLYVRRVFIMDEFKEFLPRYINFVKGVVDSDDLPLNVNRETLAQNRVLKVMSKKVTRKVLDMLKKMAADEKKAIEIEEEKKEAAANKDKDGDDADAEEDKKDEDEAKYLKLYTPFWEQYGRSIKLGYLDDQTNKNLLMKLLRFKSSTSEDKWVSLEDYVDRMGDKQKTIYYITGESEAAVKASPFLEQAMKKKVEVLYLTDPLDEYIVQSLPEFDGTPLQSLTKEGVKFGDEKKNLLKKLEDDFKPLTQWLKNVYGSKVEKVSVSNRLAQSPMVLVTSQYGWSANMERIMKSQALGDNRAAAGGARKQLEINPFHPMVKALLERVGEDAEASETKDLAELLYDAALLRSGFGMEAPEKFAQRVHRIVSSSLSVAEDAAVEEEPEEDIDEPEAEDSSSSSSSSDTSSGDGSNVYTIPPEDIKISATPSAPADEDKDEL